MATDPYQALGISQTAQQDEIRTAYRNLAKKLHPDLNPGNAAAEKRFKEVSAAYEKIGTPEARKQFDAGETPEQLQAKAQAEYARASAAGGPFYQDTQRGDTRRYTYAQGEGAGDFFENLFRSARGGARTDDAGQDQLYQLFVDFKDAALGAEREITLPQGKRLIVKIPAGVETGSRLRFKGQGGPGVGKGPPGDAYVEIHVHPLAGFTRQGTTIETSVPISFIEALTGAEISVPTIDGPVLLTVPPGVNTGTRLRVRGKGVRKGPQERGDQIVELKVVMPQEVDPQLREAVRAWNGKFNYNPRTP